MVSPNTVAISIPTCRDNRKLMIGLLDTGGHGQGSAMKGMHPVGIDVTGQIGGTANPAHGHDLVGLETQLRTSLLKALQYSKITTARTPVGVNGSLEILGLQ